MQGAPREKPEHKRGKRAGREDKATRMMLKALEKLKSPEQIAAAKALQNTSRKKNISVSLEKLPFPREEVR